MVSGCTTSAWNVVNHVQYVYACRRCDQEETRLIIEKAKE